MKFTKLITLALASTAAMMALGTTSCGSLPELPKQVGPQSSEGELPWNRPRPGEGQGQLGGLGNR